MHNRATTAAIGFAAAALLLTGCNDDPNSAPAPADPGATTTTAATAATAASTPTSTTSPTATKVTVEGKPVPDLVGKGLQAAQDAAQADGFYRLTSHDSAGRDRMQILDRDWKVCSQTPKAGATVSTDTKIDLGAVKLAESCPETDRKPPAKAGTTMPGFVGRALNTARAALPSDTSITSTDASGQDRFIIVESNWKVCAQEPAAGAPLSGQPVTFTAVKFGESCP